MNVLTQIANSKLQQALIASKFKYIQNFKEAQKNGVIKNTNGFDFKSLLITASKLEKIEKIKKQRLAKENEEKILPSMILPMKTKIDEHFEQAVTYSKVNAVEDLKELDQKTEQILEKARKINDLENIKSEIIKESNKMIALGRLRAYQTILGSDNVNSDLNLEDFVSKGDFLSDLLNLELSKVRASRSELEF